jgi:uncharacterized protein YjeT (DUF2065 family)
MPIAHWITLTAVSFILIEGFVLSIFPEQFKQLLSQADARSLQIAGALETLIAVSLFAGLMFGT